MKQLEDFVSALRSANAIATTWLVPSRQLEPTFHGFAEVSLPDDLIASWSLFNGMTVPPETPLEQTWLDGQFLYLSFDSAGEDYRLAKELWDEDPLFDAYWPNGFVPIGTPGDGSRLLVNCRDGSPTYGAVYELMHAVGVARLSNSLSRYCETLNQALDEGAITVSEHGLVKMEFQKFARIGAQMNPGCDGFDESIPSASEAKDWE
ncbi:SMI1/KNR4 family protein [Yoonia sp. GPGPB17]|uniref:SMI1/KNR4 family protein n=1 Tax=Yoonia sp. GPGPB17 TaxID=3026147 RepID=UPI0030BCE5F0